MANDTIRRRLHVSGLTPQINATHLKERFSSFGQVSDVEDLGLDGVGMSPSSTLPLTLWRDA